MRHRHKPRLGPMLGMDGKAARDAREFLDASGGLSLSDIYEASPELRKTVVDEQARRCRYSKDSGALVQTSRRKATLTGIR
jgi:hypothetical protein